MAEVYEAQRKFKISWDTESFNTASLNFGQPAIRSLVLDLDQKGTYHVVKVTPKLYVVRLSETRHQSEFDCSAPFNCARKLRFFHRKL